MENARETTTLHLELSKDTAALLRGFVASLLTERGEEPPAPERPESVSGGWFCRLTDRNAERIRAECARRAPENPDPDALVNEILDNRFRLLRWARG